MDLANDCTIQQGFIESHITGNKNWLKTVEAIKVIAWSPLFLFVVEIVDAAVVIVVEVEAVVEAVAVVFSVIEDMIVYGQAAMFVQISCGLRLSLTRPGNYHCFK